jgi:putative phosphoesterase
MLTIVSDTHGDEGHRLTGRTLSAVREAECVVHAGDFCTESVLDSFHDTTDSLAAVVGNNDSQGVRERLPNKRVVDYEGIRLVVVHGHEHSDTALSLLGRQEEADLVVFGHSHRPGVHEADDMVLLNPGSHAQPRRYRPAHAELDGNGTTIEGRLVAPDGTAFEEFQLDSER